MSIIPTDEDHPDFTRPSQFTSAAILAVTDTATTIPKVLGTFYTGGYESLLVRTSNQAAGAGWIYTFTWFADAALSVQTGQLQMETLSAIPISAQVPNRGPWCRVSVVCNFVAPHLFTLSVVPRSGTPSGCGAFLDGLIHAGAAVSIAAGGNLTQNSFGVTPGDASLTVTTGAAAWTAKLFGLDELSGVIGTFAGLNGAGGQAQSTRLVLPPYWTQLKLNNNDGVAQLFDFAVQAAL